jgi:hypothetical protein
LALDTSLEPADGSSQLLVVVEVVSEGSGQVVQFGFILKNKKGKYFFSDFGKGKSSSVLEMDEFPESGFASDEAVGNVHFPTEGRKPDH